METNKEIITIELNGSMSVNEKVYYVTDLTYDDPVVKIEFFTDDNLYHKLTRDDKKEIGDLVFEKYAEIVLRNNENKD